MSAHHHGSTSSSGRPPTIRFLLDTVSPLWSSPSSSLSSSHAAPFAASAVNMEYTDTLVLASTAAGLGLVGLLTAPALLSIASSLRQWRNRNSNSSSNSSSTEHNSNNNHKYDPDAIYEDADGRSSPEAQAAFSTAPAKWAILVLAAVGFGLAFLAAVLTTLSPVGVGDGLFLENWLAVGIWNLLIVQAICIMATRDSVAAYGLGHYTVFSCAALAAARAVQDAHVAGDLLGRQGQTGVLALRVAETAAAAALALAAWSIPRRPDVFVTRNEGEGGEEGEKDGKGRLVDRALTASAWSRWTWSWPEEILRTAAAKKNLDLSDLPRPDHRTRAAETTHSWEAGEGRPTGGSSTGSGRPLWVAILRQHRYKFALQWALTLVTAVLNFAPQYCVLQILQRLERRGSLPGGGDDDDDDAGTGQQRRGLDAWVWVLGLAVSVVAFSWVESWNFWMSYSSIRLPLRAQLSSLIFQKSMRRKDMKGGKSEDDDDDEESVKKNKGGDDNDSSRDDDDDDDDDEDDEDPTKSKQTTVNLIGVDTDHVSDFAACNFWIPNSVATLVVSLVFLLQLLEWPALVAGCAAFAAVMPLNIVFSRRYAAAQDRLMKIRDAKMGVVSEMLQGIRQIKFAALEPQWERKVGEVRGRELAAVWDVFLNDAILIFCWVGSPILLAAASLAAYALLHGSLTPSVAFVSLGVFKSLETSLSVLPTMTTEGMDAWVSVKRIDRYLRSPEIEKVTTDAADGDDIVLEGASIAWPAQESKSNKTTTTAEEQEEEEETERFVLRDVNVAFPHGELSVISGKTGAGKSLLLAAVLGEVDLLSGAIRMPPAPVPDERHDDRANRDNWTLPGAVAFVAQIPWIENATVRANVTFGLPHDERRYRDTLDACALARDVAMFADGDETEIGANGINLSGGQKWRISLARAVYSRAAVLVLDDVFSAVDAHVGRHIFERCLTGPLGAGRTRILVTHHVALCRPRTKYLVELGGDGNVLRAGLVPELGEEAGERPARGDDGDVDEEEDATAVNSEETSQAGGEVRRRGKGGADQEDGPKLTKTASKADTPRKYVEEEARAEGAIDKRIYLKYLEASGGWPFWIGVLAIFLLVGGLELGRSWWVKIWTDSYDQPPPQTWTSAAAAVAAPFSTPGPFSGPAPISHQAVLTDLHSAAQPPAILLALEATQHSLPFYLGIYLLLAVLFCLVDTAGYVYVFLGSLQASRRLFARLNHVVLHAPLRWLDTVPVGRIQNRYTTDFFKVDEHLAYSLAFAVNSLLNLVGSVVAALVVSPYVLVLTFVLVGTGLRYAVKYLHVARPIKRLESTAKSPVFEQFGTALAGVATIRGFGRPHVYVARMHAMIDDWTATSWYLLLFNRWMGWRMAVIGSLFASFVAACVLLIPAMDAALAGFALAFALEFSENLLWTIRNYADLELEMNAAERVVEYTELPTEDAGGAAPPAAWPTDGRVEVEDLVVAYAPDLEPVLKGVTFDVRGRERVGVVGRTGAGKSSLTLALFRFLEARSGRIRVDGLDIAGVPLRDLRGRLAIIPQDPVLFSGTVRSNLDPFDDHTDAELYDSLLRVHLISEEEMEQATCSSSSASAAAAAGPSAPSTAPPSGTATPTTNAAKKNNANPFASLGSPVSEGGLNLSQGQRQLLCLARAQVSRPRLMVLDEATSAVDMRTDALIQRGIRREFAGSSLLVIAHRLSTIADFDRILVLSDGRVAEFGTPRELWEKKGGEDGEEQGMFRAMCEESGERERLRAMCLGEVEGGGGGGGGDGAAAA